MKGLDLLPQIMANNPKNFILTSKTIKKMGYNEVNLNLGCPFRLLVTKNKGAGFLAKPKELDDFLYEVFAQAITKISIKTRLGMYEADEFYEILDIYNKYPVEELTIHPRVQKDFYKNVPNLKAFKEALNTSKNPICYNGDIFTEDDYHQFKAEFPEVCSLMLGRGILANPGLVTAIKKQKKVDKNGIRNFHDKIYNGYMEILDSERAVINKMKGLWLYMISIFSDSGEYTERIRFALNTQDYNEVVSSLFLEKELLEDYKGNIRFNI